MSFHRGLFSFVILLVSTPGLCLAAEKKVLVYTRNYTPDGKGYVHDNIKASVEAIRKMGKENGFAVDTSDDPAVFTDANLKQYKALIFSNSNNEAFANDKQRDGLQTLHPVGRRFRRHPLRLRFRAKVGLLSAVLGAHFKRHPKQQKFTVRVVDPKHPAARDLPATFTWGPDECYYHDNFNKDIKPLLVVDPTKLDDPERPSTRATASATPCPWPGITPSTAAGSSTLLLATTSPQYQDPILTKHILGGILWAMGDKPYPTEAPATRPAGKSRTRKATATRESH